jgi:sugar O-acyltransferase (sialic acid O-acetyltransferase NeuD family)
MTRIVLFGAGKIADAVFAALSGDPGMEVVGFTVDRAFLPEGGTLHGLPIVPFETVEAAFPPADHAMLVAVGYQGLGKLRAKCCAAARAKGYSLANWVSPAAHVPKGCTVGENCVVMPGAALQALVTLEEDVFVWHNVVVGHHARIGAHGWLASNCTISSATVLESMCFVGVNAAIGHNLTVGAHTLVGAGAIITRSTAPNGVYIVGDTPRYRVDADKFLRIARLG